MKNNTRKSSVNYYVEYKDRNGHMHFAVQTYDFNTKMCTGMRDLMFNFPVGGSL